MDRRVHFVQTRRHVQGARHKHCAECFTFQFRLSINILVAQCYAGRSETASASNNTACMVMFITMHAVNIHAPAAAGFGGQWHPDPGSFESNAVEAPVCDADKIGLPPKIEMSLFSQSGGAPNDRAMRIGQTVTDASQNERPSVVPARHHRGKCAPDRQEKKRAAVSCEHCWIERPPHTLTVMAALPCDGHAYTSKAATTSRPPLRTT